MGQSVKHPRGDARQHTAERAPHQAPSPYVAVVGINYPDGKGGEIRIEPGQPVPADLVAGAQWLLEDGAVSTRVDTATTANTAEGGTD